MRIRVFAGIGVAVAFLTLTGCRNSPTIAAYVGGQTLSEDEVTTLVEDHVVWARKQAEDGGQDPAKVEPPDRKIVVNYLVRGLLCEQARGKLKFSVEPAQLPEDPSKLLERVAQAQACERALPAGEPVKPTEAEARQIFDIGVANGIWQAETASQQIPGLMNNQDVADGLGRKKAFSDAVAGVDVTVNPKYGVVEVPLVSFQGGIPAISVMFGEPAPVDNRPAEASPPPQTQTQ